MSEAPKSSGPTKRGHPRQQTLHDMSIPQKRPRLQNTVVGDAGSSGDRRIEEAGPSSSAPTTSTPQAASAGKVCPVCSVCTQPLGRTKFKCKGYKKAEHRVHLGCVVNRDEKLCKHCAEEKAEDEAKGKGQGKV